MNSNTRQGGWIATFIIVGTLLVLGLVGGVYYLKTQQDAVNTEVATDTSSDQNTETAPKPEGSNEDESTNSTDSNKEQEEAGTATDAPAADESTTEAETDQDTASTTDELPATGPRETLAMLGVLSLIGFSGASYLRSRHEANTLQ